MSKIEELENIQKRDFSAEDLDKTQNRLQSITLAAKSTITNFKLQETIRDTKVKLQKIMRMYQQAEIKDYSLYKKVRDVLKVAHKEAFLLGLKAGGYSGDTIPKKEWVWFKSSFQEESVHIKKMVAQITSGQEKEPIKRILAYLPALQAHFSSAKMATIPYNVEIHWRLEGNHPDGANCETCLWLFKNSPYTKDTLPAIPRNSQQKCFNNCRCNLIYKHVSDIKKLENIRKKHKSASNLLKQMKKDKVLPEYMLKQ